MDPIPGIVALEDGEIVLIRHGETEFNRLDLLNGDPTVPVGLSAAGRAACTALAPILATIRWASSFVTRFPRTGESLALFCPTTPQGTVLADLDDIALGELESQPRAAYRAWRLLHGVTEAPIGGESRLAALERYARGLAALAASAPTPALVVTHDQPIRYLANTLLGADPISGPVAGIPNAVPYPLRRVTLADGAARMAEAAAALRPTR